MIDAGANLFIATNGGITIQQTTKSVGATEVEAVINAAICDADAVQQIFTLIKNYDEAGSVNLLKDCSINTNSAPFYRGFSNKGG